MDGGAAPDKIDQAQLGAKNSRLPHLPRLGQPWPPAEKALASGNRSGQAKCTVQSNERGQRCTVSGANRFGCVWCLD